MAVVVSQKMQNDPWHQHTQGLLLHVAKSLASRKIAVPESEAQYFEI